MVVSSVRYGINFCPHLKLINVELRPALRIRIQIRRIRMYLDLLDPDPLVRGMDPDPDPTIINQNSKKKLDSYCFVSFFLTFYL